MRNVLPIALLVLLAAPALAVACGGSDDATEASNGGETGGTTGTSGASGSAGTTAGGKAGASGTAGSAGNGGASGTAGTAGSAGTGGASGTAGSAGSAGTAGNAGTAGTSGGAGAAGNAGGAGKAGASGAAGSGGSSGCAAPCTKPGEVCVGSVCIVDCRQPGAVACPASTVCDVGSEHQGACVDPNVGCVVSNPSAPCSANTCGPGTYCTPSGQCAPELPCTSVTCKDKSCWGEGCSCTRPAPTCAAAPVGKPGDAGTLNDPAFARKGSNANEGAFDLEFDPSCNAWAVTMISGPDYLRKITPAGKVTSVTGVTNLNMGEVAVLLGKDGQFGGSTGDVALTYICCATCGCILSGSNGNPQGAAYFDEPNTMLPMKIPSVDFTTGAGPFGNASIDTGPYGLTWGLDRVLYVGNVKANGDFQAIDLVSGKTTPLAAMPARVHAATPFDGDRLLVAVEGGEVLLVPALGKAGAPKTLTKLPAHVTSIARDTWSGRVYAELADKTIVSFRANGTDLKTLTTVPQKGRMALAPDGNVYHLTTFPVAAEIVAFPLPTKL